ncbi:hypothetical protein BBJ28_00012281 [Nothophytophthora sp. Chile5]|nr:hypothetical protein BBJ28_00012281 [Nothophytophthora sp. Chile5]
MIFDSYMTISASDCLKIWRGNSMRDEPATLGSSDGQHQLLRDYELLLVRKHRFALADVIVCVQAIAQELRGMHHVLSGIHSSSSPAVPEAGKQAALLYDALGRMNCRLADVVRVTPTFLGEQELGAFISAIREFGKLSELELASELQLDANDTAIVEMLHRSVGVVATHTEALDRSMTCSAPVCALLTKKRDVRSEDNVGRFVRQWKCSECSFLA